MSIKRTPFNENGTWLLSPHFDMHIGNFLKSKNGQYTLTLREDGNLVLMDGSNTVWTANETQPFSATLPYRKSAPIVFYVAHSGFLQDPSRKRLWSAQATQTRDKSAWYNTYLALQDDGNILLIDIRALWSQNQNLPFVPQTKHSLQVAADTAMPVDVPCAAGPFNFVFQSNGDMVIQTQGGEAIWSSGTADKGATLAKMASDGNFSITNAAGGVLWQTGTSGHPDCWPCMQDNGKFVMIKETVTWGRFGFTPGRLPRRRVINFASDADFKTKDIHTWFFGN